jgi:S-adenosylmethionine:tRNA ribosyltransferase-isomerase
MNLDLFDYSLPEEWVAQEPLSKRDQSRLLVLDRKTGKREHRHFYDLHNYLEPGDLIVLNDTKVVPARIYAQSEKGIRFQMFFLEYENGAGRCLIQPSRKVKPGSRFQLPNSEKICVSEFLGNGEWKVQVESNKTVESLLARYGETPLPPYIERPQGPNSTDRERYQTVFARKAGAVAAPTAGLHFTEEILQQCRRKGISIAPLTLHVGIGTFLPLRNAEIEKNKLQPERFEIPQETARAISEAKKEGKKVIAVGTTVARTLESQAIHGQEVRAGIGSTDLFITPGFQFQIVDGLITNFHLPRSSLLLLVSAFAGREQVLEVYREAIEKGYRFYSYGDAMLIL